MKFMLNSKESSTNYKHGLISIIMPFYNSEAFIKDSIFSALNQSYKKIELILIDDGSSDTSYQIAKEISDQFSNIILLQQPNKGPYPARNFGLTRATGEYISFLDADDYWAENFLEKSHKQLSITEANLCYCGWQNVIENGENGEPYIPPEYEKQDMVETFLKGCPWPIHSALIKHTTLDELDGFSTRYFTSMDYDLWIRVLTVTQKITRLPEVLAFYRWHNNGQISSIKWRQVINSWKVRKDFITSNPNLVKHLSNNRLKELADGYLLSKAYLAYWDRDLTSAKKLFLKSFLNNYWHLADIKYIVLSLLPEKLYIKLINFNDQKR